jgi:malonyl-CoA O-methyltransferase
MVTQYYNKIAKGYNELHQEEQLKKIDIIKKNIKPKGLLLDIGAGTGISTKPFSKDAICIALDPSINMLKQYRGLKVCATAEYLPFKSKSFDVIISVTALHHANLKLALKEIDRVAKDNAQISLTFLKKSKNKPNLKVYKVIKEDKDLILFKHIK